MIRSVRLFTDESGQSRSEIGRLKLQGVGERSSLISQARTVSFRLTEGGGSFDWHTAPTYQFVVTLRGHLSFETRLGEVFTLNPGDVLIADDTTGGGHRWHLLDGEPWYRAYIALAQDAQIEFIPDQSDGLDNMIHQN